MTKKWAARFVGTQWWVELEGGNTSFAPNQFGKVNSYSGTGIDFATLHPFMAEARAAWNDNEGVTRFGHRASELRHRFCSGLADELNKRGIGL